LSVLAAENRSTWFGLEALVGVPFDVAHCEWTTNR
jgi:hypothetical protein